MNRRSWALALPLLSLALLACTSEPPIDAPDCVPSAAEWGSEVRAVVEQRCGACHGESPRYGAPFTLLDYASLIEGVEGERIVDRMTVQISEGSMPPQGFPQPDLQDRDAIASWASCGEVRVTDETGLGANRPPFGAPELPPEGATPLDFTLDHEPISATTLDRYVERRDSAIMGEDVFVRRMEPIVDDARVVHHLTLAQIVVGSDGVDHFKYLYAWAPGTGPIEFPGGGIRLRSTDSLRLEVHYNNTAGHEGVEDSSGVRLWLGPTEGIEYSLVDPGPGARGFSIPARESATVESTCVIAEDVSVVASMPHMHEIGTAFEVDLNREGVEPRTVLSLESWDFDSQTIYDLPLNLVAGDELTVRCHYQNMGDSRVDAGGATSDEMCYAFTYITPPVDQLCRPSTEVTELEYTPGACIETPEEAAAVTATHVLDTEAPVFDAGGVMPEGHFLLSSSIIAAPSTVVRIATFTLAGQLTNAADRAALDGAAHIIAPVDELRTGRQIDFSFAGTFDAPSGPTTMSTDCPGAGAAGSFTFGTVGGAPAALYEIVEADIPIQVWMLFSPVSPAP